MNKPTFYDMLTYVDHPEGSTIYYSELTSVYENSNNIAHYVVADRQSPLRSHRLLKIWLMEPSLFYQKNSLGVSPIECLNGNEPQLFEHVKQFPNIDDKVSI